MHLCMLMCGNCYEGGHLYRNASAPKFLNRSYEAAPALADRDSCGARAMAACDSLTGMSGGRAGP